MPSSVLRSSKQGQPASVPPGRGPELEVRKVIQLSSLASKASQAASPPRLTFALNHPLLLKSLPMTITKSNFFFQGPTTNSASSMKMF